MSGSSVSEVTEGISTFSFFSALLTVSERSTAIGITTGMIGTTGDEN